MRDAAFYIKHLQLQPHPEGGYYRETYRSDGFIPATALTGFSDSRNYSTAIFYLLEKNDFSSFHKIKSDECWHYYAGGTILIHVLFNDGKYDCIKLGTAIDKNEKFQFVVPANTWFAAESADNCDFVLTGCTVAPGFDFADFEIANREELLRIFPQHKEIIMRLSRSS